MIKTEIDRVNLIQKYTDDNISELKKGAAKFLVSTTNIKLNAKAGDTVEFLNGYDIPMSSEIIGFDKDGDILIVWDCYWFPLKPERVTKIILK